MYHKSRASGKKRSRSIVQEEDPDYGAGHHWYNFVIFLYKYLYSGTFQYSDSYVTKYSEKNTLSRYSHTYMVRAQVWQHFYICIYPFIQTMNQSYACVSFKNRRKTLRWSANTLHNANSYRIDIFSSGLYLFFASAVKFDFLTLKRIEVSNRAC